MSNLIPCEICNIPIEFDDYITHLDSCFYNASPRQNLFNNLPNISSLANLAFSNSPETSTRMWGPLFNPVTSNNIFLNQRIVRRRIIQTPENNEELSGEERNERMDANVSNELNENNFFSSFSNTPFLNALQSAVRQSTPEQLNLPTIPLNNQNLIPTSGFYFRTVLSTPNTILNSNTLQSADPTVRQGIWNIDNPSVNANFRIFQNVFRDILESPIDLLFQTLENEYNQIVDLENVPVYIEDIDSVTKIKSYNEIIDKETECAICLNTIEKIYNDDTIPENDKEFRITLCNHLFCNKCISTWLSQSKKCPICARNLEDYANDLTISNILSDEESNESDDDDESDDDV
jgi:hypothetical protein